MDRKWVIFSFVVLLLGYADGSHGDRSPVYSKCTRECIEKFDCPKSYGTFGWVYGNCFWCRYDCVWQTVEYFESAVGFIPQFHGKWPFAAIGLPFGGLVIQEPASTIFSLLNLLTVMIMLKRMRKMKNLVENRATWIIYAHVGLIAWISSTIFHTFDCDLTEKMDYFGAFAYVLSAFYVSVLHTQPQLGWSRSGIVRKRLLLMSLVAYYIFHVYSMTKNFDYGWNMTVCLTSSILTVLLWIVHLYHRRSQFGTLRNADYLLIKIISWGVVATSFEILDFVPIFWIFDAHSIFHAATVPIPIWWAQFLEVSLEEDAAEKSSFLKIA